MFTTLAHKKSKCKSSFLVFILLPVFVGKGVHRDGGEDSECGRDEDVCHVGRQNLSGSERRVRGRRRNGDVLVGEGHHDENGNATEQLKVKLNNYQSVTTNIKQI